MEGDAHLAQGEPLRQLPYGAGRGGVLLGEGVGHRHRGAGQVDAHAVADLAAEQLVHRNPGRLAGDVPERHLDGADGAAPGLEAAEPADAEHDALDVGRVHAENEVAVEEDVGLEVALGGLHLPGADDPLVGEDADYRMAADDGAPQIDNLHWVCPLLWLPAGGARKVAGRNAVPW